MLCSVAAKLQEPFAKFVRLCFPSGLCVPGVESHRSGMACCRCHSSAVILFPSEDLSPIDNDSATPSQRKHAIFNHLTDVLMGCHGLTMLISSTCTRSCFWDTRKEKKSRVLLYSSVNAVMEVVLSEVFYSSSNSYMGLRPTYIYVYSINIFRNVLHIQNGVAHTLKLSFLMHHLNDELTDSVQWVEVSEIGL